MRAWHRAILTTLHPRFGLKIVFLLLLILCFTLFRWSANRNRNSIAIERLRSDGAIPLADYIDPIGPDFLWRVSGLSDLAGRPTSFIERALSINGPLGMILYGEHFDEGTIISLKDLHHLRALSLVRTSIAGKSLRDLNEVRGLRSLSFGQRLDEESMHALAELRGLSDLWLNESAEEESVQYLREKLPSCTIHTD